MSASLPPTSTLIPVISSVPELSIGRIPRSPLSICATKRPAKSGEGEQGGGNEDGGPAKQHQRAFGDNGVEFQARYG